MNWKDAEKLCSQWGGHFVLKGVMSVDDAKKQLTSGAQELWFPITVEDNLMVPDLHLIN